MKNYFLDLTLSSLIFLFLIFAISNICFLLNLSIMPAILITSFLISIIYLLKCKKKYLKIILFCLILILSLVFSMFFIDTSFDGRCYHFTIENLFKLGYNPIYDNIFDFSSKNNIFFNLVFASSYPNAIELIRSNFYLILDNIEASKIVNYLIVLSGFFYSFYFLNQKLTKIKSLFLSIVIILCSVSIMELSTKLNDLFLYYLFIFQVFSIYLIRKNIDKKKNYIILILSTILSIATKYIGLFNSVIVFSILLICKLIKKENLKNYFKTIGIIILSSLILSFQPYITNIIKYKNPLYPSIGYNKLDFMTKQNPREFQNKPYIYKFFRSMFSSSSDARIANPLTPPIFYKIPFTKHFDMPYGAEELRISGFGYLFSGIFLLSVIFTIYLLKRRRGILLANFILLTVFLNPLCWWARFVPQLYLLPILNCYYLKTKKENILSYILIILLIVNGLWIVKENFKTNAYRTYVIDNYYKNLPNNIDIYIDKNNEKDENDETILARLTQYGIRYNLVDKKDDSFKKVKIETTISGNYYLNTNKK